MTSGPKGSNPGGKCKINSYGRALECYIKSVDYSILPRNHPFVPQNQPIYEAITLALAEEFGLAVPQYYLLVNQGHKIKFTHASDVPKNEHMRDGQKEFYFLSELITIPIDEDLDELHEKMIGEKLYRDLLMVGDVSGRKQNYALIESPQPSHPIYIDLGCSFVDAHYGKISQRNENATLLRDRKGEYRPGLKQDLKHAQKFLRRYGVGTGHLFEFQKRVIEPMPFTEALGDLQIPVFPRGRVPIKNLLTGNEIEEIKMMLQVNFARTLRDFRKHEMSLDSIIEL